MNRDAEPAVRWAGRKKTAHRVAGNRQRQAACNHGVYAHDLPARVGQRAAGISGRETHFGLYPGVGTQTSKRANAVNYSRGKGPDEAQGIANRNDKFARAQLRRISGGSRGEIRGVDMEAREIVQRIA